MTIYVYREEETHGPFSQKELLDYLDQGHCSSDDLVCEDEETWLPLCELLKEIAPSLFVYKDEETHGPFSRRELLEYVDQGHFTVDDLVCEDGETWLSFNELLQPDISPETPVIPVARKKVTKTSRQQPAARKMVSRGQPVARKKGNTGMIAIVCCLLLVVSFILFLPKKPEGGQDQELRSSQEGENTQTFAKADKSETAELKAQSAKLASEHFGSSMIPESRLKPFLENNCINCHGERKQKGDVRLDQMDWGIANNSSMVEWQDVLDVLNVGEMPPEDEDQPSADELAAFIGDVAENIKLARKKLEATGGKISMRYLAKREYLSSMTDLFGIEMPEGILPNEISPEFDTIGSDQYFSLKQYEQFYTAGREVVEKNIIAMTAPYDSKTVRHDPEVLPAKEAEEDLLRFKKTKVLIDANASLSEIAKVEPTIGDAGQVKIFKLRYEGKLITREKKYEATRGPGLTGIFTYTTKLRPNSLYKLSLTAAGITKNKKGKIGRQTIVIVNDEEVGNFNFESSAMTSPEVSFSTGVMDSDFEINVRGSDVYDYLSLTGPFEHNQKKVTFFKSLVSPVVKKSESNETEIAAMLTKFAERAFRYQGVDKDYISALLKVYRLERSNGKDIANSLIEPLTAIVTAPAFLYVKEKNDGKRNTLSQNEFAIRMAYFLWRTPPDKELYELAASNSLYDPGVLNTQFERMLLSDKADLFLTDFINQWSGITRFDEIDIPSNLVRGGFPISARREISEFFKVLVRENLAVDNLIESDFVVVDAKLAHRYGLRIQRDATGFKKIKLPALDSKSSIGPRGGMLTQFAFLMIGSSGARTSPTIRGTLIREKFLFDAPPPPPPNVPAIEPPKGKRFTVRQLVDRHMNVPQCASCHEKIDPIGLGLENFDYLGMWRTEEIVYAKTVRKARKGQAQKKAPPPETVPVDARGQLYGESFNDFKGLQQELLRHKDKLALSIYESMLSYGIGRKVEFIDDTEIHKSLSELKEKNYPLKEMVFAILTSQIFANKYPGKITNEPINKHIFPPLFSEISFCLSGFTLSGNICVCWLWAY